MSRTLTATALILGAFALAVLAWGYASATADPILRETQVEMPGLRPGVGELRVVLIADLHVAGPDMPPSRLRRIVGRVNGLDPDLVLVAGDLISDRRLATRQYGFHDAAAPLADIRARLGIVAVLGNHDHWRDAKEARAALRAAGVTVLDNDVVRAGPLAVGGLDDAFTGHDDVGATVRRLRAVGGVPILLSHSPDPFPRLPNWITLSLAGHTHCGQVRLPLIGAMSYMSEYGTRYGCGRIDEDGKTLIVSAGLGTSILPLRFGAPPDLWLVRLTASR